ncbi:pepsin/retropepsin-like aspartic protease family protein [Massilia varians]|nr:pepsin/retropepsin-like aspartic protease family protein [Massilia varians]
MTLQRPILSIAILYAGLLMSHAAWANSLPAGCEMREQAHIPLSFADDLRPVGEATINGSVVPAMLSTGAGESLVFNKKILERLGIEVRHTTSKLDAEDMRNPKTIDLYVDFSHANIKDFSIGPVKGKGGTYKVENFMDDTYGVRVGAGMLLQNDLEIALDAGYLKSFNPSGCIGAHLAYWDPQAASVLALWHPWQRDARVAFIATIGGQPIHALLSTATPHSYVPKAAAARLGLTPDSPGATREAPLPGHAADKPVWKVPVPLMSIGSLEVKDLDLRLMDLSHEGEALVLGADFLHRHRVYVAMEQKRIYFSPITVPQTRKRGSVQVIPQPLN